MVFILIEYGAGVVVFGLFYRSVNFNTLDLTMCLCASVIIYQMTPYTEFKELYCPCVRDQQDERYQDYISRKSGKRKPSAINQNNYKASSFDVDDDESSGTDFFTLGTPYTLANSDLSEEAEPISKK